MKRILFPIILVLSVFAPLQAQTDSLFAISSDTHIHWLSLVRENRQISFNAEIPPGNYSGITPIGNGLYAVVDDKMQDGFYVFSLKFNQRGELTSVYNVGFLDSGNANRDAEGIVFVPSTKTIFTSGEKRNDVLKQHPCLIAYEDLPEEEKVYDRNTSIETLKLILKLGFKISRE